MDLDDLLLDFIKKDNFSLKKLDELKRAVAKNQKKGYLRHSDIYSAYEKLLAAGKIKRSPKMEELLQIRKIRTLSGVAPVAVLTKPWPCPGECIYCPNETDMPKSYLSDEPAVLRAQLCDFDAYKQVKLRLEQYEKIGHTPEKVELIVMGGTWSALPKSYQLQFITDCFKACNQANNTPEVASDASRKTPRGWKEKINLLKQKQRKNENSKYRIIGLTLETRPDQINEKEIQFMRLLGATRVELGVQSIYDDVLKKVNRGHPVSQTVIATKLLKDAGFKVCYHLMPNLPGSNPERDLQMFKTIFTDQRFMPDMIKIYPCVITKGTELYQWFKKGKFQPYTDKQLIDLLIKIKQLIPEWVRINRLYRDIPAHHIVAGSKLSNIRQILQKKMKDKNLTCSCIRCREIKEALIAPRTVTPDASREAPPRWKMQLKIIKYKASGGQEYFLQYVDSQNRLYALLRLRISNDKAIIREVHTFGQALGIGERSAKIQHLGLGKKLIKKAEEICQDKGIKKVAVISGVGARPYYRKLKYYLKNGYMVKKLSG